MMLLAIPLGVAAQSLLAGMVLVALLWQTHRNLGLQNRQVLLPLLGSPWLLGGAGLLVLQGLADLLNEKHSVGLGAWLGHAVGYLPYLILPVFLPTLVYRSAVLRTNLLWAWGWFLRTVPLVLFCLALSQHFWGWALQGQSLQWGLHRPRGFYSHPLTLAYVCLCIWPFVLLELRKRTTWVHLGAMLSTLGVIVLADSRTVQGVALVFAILILSQDVVGKRWRSTRLVFLVLCTLLAAVWAHSQQKWVETVSDQGHDVSSAYADDRLAFWHAHWEMFREKPWIGHGFSLGKEYRQPYYEQIGLGDFPKIYEAHNLYLQILVNSGLLGLMLFFLTFYWAYLQLRSSWTGLGLLAVLLLGSITQNSLFDFEVRYTFAVLLALALSFAKGSSQVPGGVLQENRSRKTR
jgi:O-antigen ligase